MKSRTKFFIFILLFLAGVFVIYHFSKQTSTFSFEFAVKQNNNDPELEKIVNANLDGAKGHFAVVVEELEATSSAKRTPENTKKYVLNEKEIFPAASLYKLVLMAATFKEIEKGPSTGSGLTLETMISGSKSDLTSKFGSLDFGYEEAPGQISYSVDEALTRIGRISDNFAAIMLTEKLRANRSNNPLVEMAQELGMKNTDFDSDPIQTTAEDIATFFRAVYKGQVVSQKSSEEIIKYLSLSQINNRIPAKLPEGVKVVHKTGELSKVRHDAGLVLPNLPNSPNHPYLIILLSKDLEFEDDGVDTLANISKGVYDYFSK